MNGAQPKRPLLQPCAVFPLRAFRGVFDEAGTGQRRDAQILSIDASSEVVAPGEEMVHPGGNRVQVAANGGCGKAAVPAIVPQWHHMRFMPHRLHLASPKQQAGERVVAIGKAVGLDHDFVADDTLGGKATTVHGRGDALDYGAHAAINHGQFCFSHVPPRWRT